MRCPLGVLAGDSPSEEVSAVQVVHGIVSVSVVLELNEGVPDKNDDCQTLSV